MTDVAAEKKKTAARPKRYDRQITVRVGPKVVRRLREIQKIHRLESLSGALRLALTEMLD